LNNLFVFNIVWQSCKSSGTLRTRFGFWPEFVKISGRIRLQTAKFTHKRQSYPAQENIAICSDVYRT